MLETQEWLACSQSSRLKHRRQTATKQNTRLPWCSAKKYEGGERTRDNAMWTGKASPEKATWDRSPE